MKTIKIKIHHENGASFLYLQTNLRKEPLKLLVDTGAFITLLAEDVFEKYTHKIIFNNKLDLYGISGEEASIKTKGVVNGMIGFNNHLIETKMHLVERKYAGPGDGSLGFDFLTSFKAIINMIEMSIKFDLNEITKEKDENENEYEKENNDMKAIF